MVIYSSWLLYMGFKGRRGAVGCTSDS